MCVSAHICIQHDSIQGNYTWHTMPIVKWLKWRYMKSFSDQKVWKARKLLHPLNPRCLQGWLPRVHKFHNFHVMGTEIVMARVPSQSEALSEEIAEEKEASRILQQKFQKKKNTHLVYTVYITVSINISTAALTNHQHVVEEWSHYVRLCLAVNIAAVVQVESFMKTRELQPCDGHCKSALMQAPPVAPRSSGDVSRSQSDTVLACLRRCRTGPHPNNIWQWWHCKLYNAMKYPKATSERSIATPTQWGTVLPSTWGRLPVLHHCQSAYKAARDEFPGGAQNVLLEQVRVFQI